jgi:hypothetical protein
MSRDGAAGRVVGYPHVGCGRVEDPDEDPSSVLPTFVKEWHRGSRREVQERHREILVVRVRDGEDLDDALAVRSRAANGDEALHTRTPLPNHDGLPPAEIPGRRPTVTAAARAVDPRGRGSTR